MKMKVKIGKEKLEKRDNEHGEVGPGLTLII